MSNPFIYNKNDDINSSLAESYYPNSYGQISGQYYGNPNTGYYPKPVKNIYKCNFSGSGKLEAFSIAGTTTYDVDSIEYSWSGGEKCTTEKFCWGVKGCKWKGTKLECKVDWKCSDVVKCEWTELTLTAKTNWSETWKSSEIILSETTIDITIDTNLNIDQLNPDYILSITPPTDNVPLTNHRIQICDYNLPLRDASYNVIGYYTKMNTDTSNDSPIDAYLTQSILVSDYTSDQPTGIFPTTYNLLPGDVATTTTEDPFTYETYVKLDLYIDTNNTSSWIYFKANFKLTIYDATTNVKIDSNECDIIINMNSITKI